jgi:GR25 family glycosyltransferase involved in LPS biosynthesis
MIAKAIELNRPVVILEDDVIIHDFEKMKQHVRDVQQLEWDILYFYWGRDCLPRVAGARDSHAYMVNHKSAARLLGLLQARRAQLEQKGSKTVISYFDQALSKLTYEDIFARGSTDIICQNRARFGSDTGWGHKGTPKLLED